MVGVKYKDYKNYKKIILQIIVLTVLLELLQSRGYFFPIFQQKLRRKTPKLKTIIRIGPLIGLAVARPIRPIFPEAKLETGNCKLPKIGPGRNRTGSLPRSLRPRFTSGLPIVRRDSNNGHRVRIAEHDCFPGFLALEKTKPKSLVRRTS